MAQLVIPRRAFPIDRRTAEMDDLVELCTDPVQFTGHAMSWALDCGHDGNVRLETPPTLETVRGKLPQQDEVLLWLCTPSPYAARAPLDQSDLVRFLPFLNDEECDRLNRFRFTCDRWSYAAAHACLRLILSNILDIAPPSIKLDHSSNGKPCLSEGVFGLTLSKAVQFNISHTRGMVAVALSGRPVGIDVEPVLPLPDMRQLVVDLMSTEAVFAFDACQCDSDRIDLFFRFWTLGEAFIKATGLGMEQGLGTFAFTAAGEPWLTRVTRGWGEARRWRFGHTPAKAALASHAAHRVAVAIHNTVRPS